MLKFRKRVKTVISATLGLVHPRTGRRKTTVLLRADQKEARYMMLELQAAI